MKKILSVILHKEKFVAAKLWLWYTGDEAPSNSGRWRKQGSGVLLRSRTSRRLTRGRRAVEGVRQVTRITRLNIRERAQT